jgi:glycogen debranching enzyme
LYPLLTGRLARPMNDRLIAHLLAPEEFWARFPIATVARNDAKYNPDQMWRGPTWVNINYLFIEGLARCGYTDLARELRERTLKLLMAHDDIFEYYNPETGEPPARAARLFGWSSAIFVDLAIEASRDREQRLVRNP